MCAELSAAPPIKEDRSVAGWPSARRDAADVLRQKASGRPCVRPTIDEAFRPYVRNGSQEENLTPSISCPDYPLKADMAALYEYTP
jgi:hypothetical protein